MRARIFAEENRKWWTLWAVAFALFMIMLDNTVVNVALPSIQQSLHANVSELEWVVSAYALTFAVLLLTGGKLGDLYGRRRIFLLGLAVFALSSLACALAPSAGALIGARTAQGVGAALMMPATLAILSAAFPPHQRGLAFGIWAGSSAVALALGPLVGGLLTEHVNWNWIFYINVPIGAIAIVAGRIIIRESRDTSKVQSLDLPGLLSSGVGLFALTFGLIEANRYGWTSPMILGLFGVAIAAFVGFVLIERRQRAPMLDLDFFRSRTFTGGHDRRLPRHPRHVRDLLLHVALRAANSRLLPDSGRRYVPADDRADHLRRADLGKAVRPRGLALAHGRRSHPGRHVARDLLDARRTSSTFRDMLPGFCSVESAWPR